MKFFFSRAADQIDIWWTETYKDFLGELETPKNLMHFGVFLISNDDIAYAVSLGKAHFYLGQFCDTEFGLNLAERIINENALKIKNLKFYKSAKNKMITTYKKDSQLSLDSGESMHYIKGGTINSRRWGKVVSFGTSVHLNIAIEPSGLVSLIPEIETTLEEPARVEIPKVSVIKNQTDIQRLDRFLARRVVGNQEESTINVEEFTMSGIDFLFSDNYEYSLYLKGHSSDAVRLDELSIESLKSFLRSQSINFVEEINNLKVKVHNEHGRDHTKSLKFYLDCIKEDERCCLIDGVWHQFNQSYVAFLKREVDQIGFDYNPSFDIPDDMREDQFNEERSNNDGYLNFDKDLISLEGKYRVEMMDLYKDSKLFFVKKGKPQKLSYVIDQAINTVKILQNNAQAIAIEEESVTVEEICLWMILDRQIHIQNLSDINSIIFHMKLVEWKKVVIDAGFRASIKINYKRIDE